MNKIATKVLVVDDEPQLRKMLAIGLTSYDYQPIEAVNGKEALKMAVVARPDIIILDLGLPDIAGTEVIRQIREWSKIPIIVLSVRADESDKIEAFDCGANDYVTKPFGVGELMARIRASLRDHIAAETASPVFSVGDLRVDVLKHEVTLRGKRIKLSPKEYTLLRVLITNAGRVITHKQLMKEVWGQAYSDSDNQYLRIYIRQLRQKLEIDRQRDQYIHNEQGIGYRLEEPYSS